MATNTPNIKLPKPALTDKVVETIGTDLPKAFDVLDALIPVGEIKMFNRADVNPNLLYPGTTWTQIHDVFLVASGSSFTAGSTGGASEHYHVTPIGFDGNQIYYHHDVGGDPAYGSETLQDGVYTEEVKYKVGGALRQAYTSKASNLPPYRAVFIWERTA